MKSKVTGVMAVAAAAMVVLGGCSSSSDTASSSSTSAAAASGSGSAAAADDAGKRACVMLPDADSSSRWENGDRPALQKGFEEAGFEVDIQNALNDTGKYATLADQQLTQGCDVMLLVDLNGAGVQVATKAKAQGIPVIAYDRPIKGADYYISFDNFHVGELEGQMIVDGLKADGKDIATANVVYIGGDPTDGNAKQFHDGADSVLKAAGMQAGVRDAGHVGPPEVRQTHFEQAYTALDGKVDAVWAANDTNAGAVDPGAGQERPDRSRSAARTPRPIGLQNVLLGKQSGTVYKPFQLEATAAVDLAPAAAATARRRPPTRRPPDGTPVHRRDPDHRRPPRTCRTCSTTATPRSPTSAPAPSRQRARRPASSDRSGG